MGETHALPTWKARYQNVLVNDRFLTKSVDKKNGVQKIDPSFKS